MKLSIAIVVIATALVSCATMPPPYALLDWNDFMATFPGQPEAQAAYPGGATKVAGYADAAASIASGNERFARWCAAHGGKSDVSQVLARSNAMTSAFHNGLSLKLNAERAQGVAWTPTAAVACASASGGDELIAVMVSEPGLATEALTIQGKRIEKLTRVFFDGRQASEFAVEYVKREEVRVRRFAAVSRDRATAKAEATARLRSQLKTGDRTSVGLVVEVRPPLALVQYDQRYRELSSRPATEWLPISSLVAPSD